MEPTTELEVEVVPTTESEVEVKEGKDDPIKKLQHLASRGQWRQLVEKCRETPLFIELKIFSNEETILHVLVSEDQMKVLEKLAEMGVKRLEIGDQKGNTPLHLAASMGKKDTAKCLVIKHSKLIEILNEDKESPLFVAAACGKKDTFLYLFSQCPREQGIEYLRGRDDIEEVRKECFYKLDERERAVASASSGKQPLRIQKWKSFEQI
ncbi:hypothetical protein ACLOJK_026767 [Asimina triloba]